MPNSNNQDVLILIVDDDPVVRETLRALLSSESYRIEQAGSGEEAIEKTRKLLPDVIVLDVMMPGMDGYEVTERLKADPDTILIPIILVTALDSRQERLCGINAGADDFLTKPVDRLQFLARVRTAVRLRRVSRELDDAETVLESLARSIAAKDDTTGNHCDRLMAEAEGFGTYLGLMPAEIRALRRAAILHDVGKIGIPESILLKPGALNEQEWAVMKSHSQIGVNLLAPLRTMNMVLAIVGSHHEQWSGGGYPLGLRGEEIPYLARVFQLIDVYDALTNERPYKEAIPIEKALEIIRAEAADGKWDPKLVEAYIAWKRSGGDA